MKVSVLIAVLLLGLLALVTAKSIAKCKCNCTLDYKPVCAVDAKLGDSDTFPNECALECYNCSFEKNYVVLKRGECTATTTAKPRPRPRNRIGRSLWWGW